MFVATLTLTQLRHKLGPSYFSLRGFPAKPTGSSKAAEYHRQLKLTLAAFEVAGI
jgi:hypothetical protein